jgi:site-specific DNA recombinase
MEDKIKVGLYIRVSTGRQVKEGDSLEEQENELKKFCEYRNFQIHKIYIEKGRSGGNTNRPEYQKLLKDMQNNKIGAVVVKKVDRFSRSSVDFENFINLAQKNEVEFISLRENFDTTTAIGKAMLKIVLVFAQLEREQTSERLIDVLDFRASQGMYNGGIPPYGYTNVNKELIPYPREKQVVQMIFSNFLEHKSTASIARLLNESDCKYRKNKLWIKQQIQRILQNPVYIGKTKWKGGVYQGLHQPMISDKQFALIQEIFKLNRYGKESGQTKAMLQKLLVCGFCFAPMTPSHSVNRHKKKYYYYRCTTTNQASKSKCEFKYVSFKAIESRVFKLLLALSEEKQFSIIENRTLKHNQIIEKEIQKNTTILNNFETKLELLKAKREKYLDSLITGDFSSSERQKINAHIDEMEMEEKQITSKIFKLEFELNKQDDNLINITQLKRIFISFKTDYEVFTSKELRSFLGTHLEKIIYYPEKLEVKFKLLEWTLSFNF